MNNTWLKIKIWTKLILIGLVALFVLIFVAANGSHDATVWLWHDHTFNVLELMAGSFLFGALVTLLARPIYRTLGEIHHLKRPRADSPIHSMGSISAPTIAPMYTPPPVVPSEPLAPIPMDETPPSTPA